MFRQAIQFKLTFVLILYMRLCLEVHAASDICTTCKCINSWTIYCSNRNLISVPQAIPSTVESLYLSSNQITIIESGAFVNLTMLSYLYLGSNKITIIESGAFVNLTVLSNLYLQSNQITNIERGAFENLNNLVWLDLRSNKITSIERGAFVNLTKLRYLYLSSNQITIIERGAFVNLTMLSYLDLRSNKIKSIERGAFVNLNMLRDLYLSSNQITIIERGAFVNLTMLSSLYLQSNQITNIERGAFENLNNLVWLYLSSNKITNIKREDFEYLTNLRSLHLGSNNITIIESGAFVNLTNLYTLYLGSNKITIIERGAFVNLTNLYTLHLQSNQIPIIERGAFVNLTNLYTLYLQSNQIKNIERGVFVNLTNLGRLNLAGNQITNIERGAFETLTKLSHLDLSSNKITNIKREDFEYLTNLQELYLGSNKITIIESGAFVNLTMLSNLQLQSNQITNIERGAFENLNNLGMLQLQSNQITNIERGAFENLNNLVWLHLSSNRIKTYEDGAFLFLPSIRYINLASNKDMMCGCHLPAVVNYTKRTYNINVQGKCHTDLGSTQDKVIPILKYSQCKDYSLFQRNNLQCQKCSGMMCNDSEVTNCTGDEPVCQTNISRDGKTLKFEKSCSSYRKCLESMRKSTFTCNKGTKGTFCLACCTGNLCNKNDFIGWTNSFVFHLISTMNPNSTLKKVNIYRNPAENISKAMEHELLNLTGEFKVEYCGLEKNREIFTIYCTVPSEMTKDEVLTEIQKVFSNSQILRNLGVLQRNMEFIGERVCNENTTSINNRTLSWPVTKVGTSVTIPCHANIATRHCSSRTAIHLEMATSHNMTSPKCSPFIGIWQEPDISQCYNTKWITEQLKSIASEDIDKENIKEFSNKLLNISQNSVYFKEDDIALAVDIHEKIVPLLSTVSHDKTLNNIILSINNIINTPEEILVEAEKSDSIVNRMLDIIEAIPEKISLEEQKLVVLHSNLGIGVIKVDKDTFNGVSYAISFGTNEAEIYNSVYPDRQQETMDFISLPNSLLKHLKDEEQSTISRISFFSMKNDKLYRIIQKTSSGAKTKIVSRIIAANIPNIQLTNLDEPVTISFNLIYQTASNLKCVSWNESPGQNPHWSTKGCSVSNVITGKKVVCSCNQLASVALVMETRQNEGNIKMFNPYLLYFTLAVAYHFSVSFLQ